jgi:D-aminopeptidase
VSDVGAQRLRAREVGLSLGTLPPGTLNAITDVAGVRVGHVTLIDNGASPDLRNAVRTGVTAILPHEGNLFREKVPAAVHVINGYGKIVGTTQVAELGVIETPIVLTNTLSVGIGFAGVVDHALRNNPEIGDTTGSVNPLVAECNDSQLNDIRGRHVSVDHVLNAIDAARLGPVAEGAVGAGTGMVCYGWKGGIGTASRVLPAGAGGFTIGALLLTNFGEAAQLTIDGRHVGTRIVPPAREEASRSDGAGSCIAVVATDAPVSDRQLARLARRVQNGLARTGNIGAHMSGEYAIAFTTARRVPHWPAAEQIVSTELAEDGTVIDLMFQAVVESVEEAVINSLFTANTVVGRGRRVRHGIPVDEVLQLLGNDRAS